VSIARSVGIAVGCLALAVAVRPREAQQQPPVGAVHVPRSVLERYVGEYVYPSGATAMVRLRGDTLYREIPGQQVPFVPLSATRFKLGPVFTAEFVIDAAGGVTKILSDGLGTEFRLPRRAPGAAAPPAPPAASPAPAAASVRVPREVLARYVGEYEFLPGQMRRTDLTIVVRLRGDTLTRQISAGPELVLTPLSETRFRVGSTSSETEFVIDQAGGVTQVMGSGSQQLKARRTPKR
jgi:hypothetical protein